MKTFISDYITQLSEPYHTVTNLFKFVFSQTYYFTSFAQDVTYDSAWYLPRGIKFDEARLQMNAGVDSLDLVCDNADKWWSTLMLAENVVGKEVYLYQAALDNNLKVIHAELIFFGYVDKRRYNQTKATVTVKNHMALWRRQTPPAHTVACRWQFKEKADEVLGTDDLNYRCIVDHPATADDCPTTGANYASYWQQIGNSGGTWASGTNYQAGTCQFPGRYLAFTSGSEKSAGVAGIVVGDTITGNLSLSEAYVDGVQLNSGTWAAGTAVGVVTFRTQTGPFQSEYLDVGAVSNIATIAGDSTAPADYACDQSWERCTIYGNNANFGGNRWLPWLEDPGNSIWWGRVPKKD